MAYKELAMATLLQRTSFAILLAFLLRTVVGELEKSEPEATVNRTVSFIFGVSQQQNNASNNNATLAREPKALKMVSHKNSNITTTTDHPVTLAVHLESTNKSNDQLLAKTTRLPFSETSKSRRSTPHRKYSNRQYSSAYSEYEDKKNSYVNNEDYSEQLYQNYQQDYYVPQPIEYEDPYNTIPVEQNLPAYDSVVPDSYRDPYPAITTDSTYYDGPPPFPTRIPYEAGPLYENRPPYEARPLYENRPPYEARPTYEEEPHRNVYQRNCHCPQNRQMSCDNTSADFIALVGSLGANLWALLQLIVTSSLPFIIPLLMIKLILVPIGIMKFLALIKLVFKLFIILPFFVRHVYPAFTHSFNLHDLIFQKIQDAASHIHNHEIPHHHDEDIESRTNFNASSILSHEAYSNVNDTKIWDLRGCPNRVACELGAFLSTSTYLHFPQKLANYLSKKADRVEIKSKIDGSADSNEVDDEDADEKQNQVQPQDQAFKAFIIALGKKWTQEQCQIYSCSVLS